MDGGLPIGDETTHVLIEPPELVLGEYPVEEVYKLLYDGWVSHHRQRGIINNN